MIPPANSHGAVVERAPAKINLFLDILARRGDGFHDLATLFVKLSLADEITLSTTGEAAAAGGAAIRHFTVEGTPEARPDLLPRDERNLAWRALVAMSRAHGAPLPPCDLHLVKRVPHGAGLGGGSSDAAAVLRAANRLFALGWGADRLAEIAATLGSDCPVFAHDWPAATGAGRGEVLAPAAVGRALPMLLVLPSFPVSTAEAYGALRPEHLGPRTDAGAAARWLAQPDGAPPPLHNSFEAALHDRFPALATAREELRRHGALAARLSGSGSATFGIFATTAQRDAATEAMSAKWGCLACESVW